MTRILVLMIFTLFSSCGRVKTSEWKDSAREQGFVLLDEKTTDEYNILVFDAGRQGILLGIMYNKPPKFEKISGYEISLKDSLGRDIEAKGLKNMARLQDFRKNSQLDFCRIIPIESSFQNESFTIDIVQNLDNKHYTTIYEKRIDSRQ